MPEEFFGMLIGFGLVVVLPLVAVLTHHQRKMAELVHRNHGQAQASQEISALRQEIYELKQLIHQQAIALDSYASRTTESTERTLTGRLG